MRTLILVAAIFLSSCGARTVYVNTPLEVPPRPALVGIESVELSCLADQTYIKLVQREMQFRVHVETLEAIIRSTQTE